LSVTYSSGTCTKLNTDDGPYKIVAGNQLFLNGLRLGELTPTGFSIDFTDFSQGYPNRLMIEATLNGDGSLLLYQSLKGGGYVGYTVGKFEPK